MVHDSQGYQCDIVLPVYNGLSHVKDCIGSLLSHTTDVSHRLYIIDDASDPTTSTFLSRAAMENAHIHLHRNDSNSGFVKSCNLGIQLGTSPYVLLINSDVIVTPGWLSRMLRCVKSDDRIAAVNPFTNHASNISIPLAPGANFWGMDHVLRRQLQHRYPDVVTCVGFCLLLRRSALEQVGLFDEVFGHGYCEESDLCMRLTTNGWRTVIADDVYVYHKGRASFTDRGERYRRNRAIFDQRWAQEYLRQFRAFQRTDPLRPARKLFQAPQRWDPVPSMRETYRQMRTAVRQKDAKGLVKAAAKGLLRLPSATRSLVSPEFVAKLSPAGRLRVTYVLPALSMAGGVLSVIQLVNELILLGVEARIVALSEYPEVYHWKFLQQPIVFHSERELFANFPASDVIVATHWTTAPWVAELARRQGAVPVYFLQDYEAWFYPESDSENRRRVLETYKLIPNKIVKSDWLSRMLRNDGYSTRKIRLGMDLATFYPRKVDREEAPTVIAMARPRTPRRGFPHIVKALRLVKQAMPEAEVVLFGEDLQGGQVPANFQLQGLITSQERLAQLYSRADVFLDGSDFQGFGRPALEAMACGVACVLTEVGGVTEYARHMENCLLVPPKDPEAFSQAILELLRNPELRLTLIHRAQQTVQDYCHKREARETLAYFEELLRPGAER